MTLIDPRWPPARVLAAVAGCSLLLSEAMHGVIVADAMRVPWVALRPQARIHRAKWLDWAGALDLDLRFQRLPASSADEWSGKAWPRFGARVDRWFVERAAAALRAAAGASPTLSSDAALHRSQDRMMTCLESVRRQRPIMVAA